MSSFINSLIDRSTEPVQSIRPRVRGKFERNVMPADLFTGAETNVFNTSKPAQTQDEIIPDAHKATPVRTSMRKHTTGDPAKDLDQSRTIKSSPQHTEQIKDDGRPAKPPRFEPSYKLTAPQLAPEKTFEKQVPRSSNNVDPYTTANTPVDKVRSTRDQQQQPILPGQPQPSSNSISKTTVFKEVHKTLPFVIPAAHLVTPSEAPQKAHLKQTVDSFIHQKAAVEHSQTINISIGRIEVRVSQTPAQVPMKPKDDGVAIMSLDEYLQKRNQGS